MLELKKQGWSIEGPAEQGGTMKHHVSAMFRFEIVPNHQDVLSPKQGITTPNRSKRVKPGFSTAVLCATICGILFSSYSLPFRAAEKYGDPERRIVLDMVQTVRNDIDTKYYDPTFHGTDMNARFQEAESKIRNSQSYLEGIVTVVWALDGLNDSHTFLIPPPQPFDADYGFRFQFYGSNCYVNEVKKGSDAQKQGLLAGDRLLAIDGQKLVRSQYFQLKRSLEEIAPRSKVRLAILPAGSNDVREVSVETKIMQLPARMDSADTRGSGFGIAWALRKFDSIEESIKPESAEAGDVMVWRQPTFIPYTDIGAHVGSDHPPLGERAELLLDRARKNRAVVLDLRGNPGGPVLGEQWLIGAVFDHDVQLYDVVSRGQSKTVAAKTLAKKTFTGILIVLVDSNSGSQAESFARVVQIEKRGNVIGDQTAGRVREAEVIHHQEFNVGTTPHYFVSVSTGDLVMRDGKSLEGIGVTPDIVVLPTSSDLAAGRDPVLAAAFGLAGHPMDPGQAGKLLPSK